ncbi:TspO/MBR family protein [Marinobacteraceae bacterium S3BR75-40.1]
MPRFVRLILFLLLLAAIAASGALFSPGPWYAALAKPAWTPPNWLFPPVWTLLYILIAVAGWLAWEVAAPGQRRKAFTVYGAQLVANFAWSWLVFGQHLLGWGLVDILLLFGLIAFNLVLFQRIRRLAGLLLWPYLLWVGYAATLNLGLVVMNG